VSYDDFDPGDLHEDCVPADDALSYVMENHWDEVEEIVNDSRGQAWLARSKPYIELLSIVSQRDREHMRGAIKLRLRKRNDDGDEPSDDQLFAIAADVSAFLEQLPKTRPLPPITYQIGPGGYQGSHQPTADRFISLSARKCSLDDDLSWARELLVVSRAFRDFLSAVSDPDVPEPLLRLRISKPIGVFNNYLHKTPAQVLIYWQPGDKQLRFGRCPDPVSPDLSSFVANWISDYLENYYSYVGLGVCAECGKFFVRERRDKTFCSKTCQNRVAYKRKKLLDSNALAPVDIPPDCAYDISAGLWTHHPRYGIGLVESVTSGGSEMAAQLAKVPTNPDEAARYRSMLSRKINVQIRFLHGVRMFRYSDLFEGQKKEDQVPTFYEVKSEETLAELL
jgi:hypothetical protein